MSKSQSKHQSVKAGPVKAATVKAGPGKAVLGKETIHSAAGSLKSETRNVPPDTDHHNKTMLVSNNRFSASSGKVFQMAVKAGIVTSDKKLTETFK
ncbi:hypothetical protein [Delftia sp. GW456-R20]|uniref:hypothetical protein n=1 Tax=Delftia sp. GW456-R20 TaxID=1827145 RepID=UPI000B2D68EC|nr:hypothetical protein [Delftia sp. GW456-R20]